MRKEVVVGRMSIKAFCSVVILVLLCMGICFSASEIQTDRTGAKPLSAPDSQESFTFVIVGDRAAGKPEGLDVLRQAIGEINLLNPDFVITIGDTVEGYNQDESWQQQTDEYLAVIKDLRVPWFPVVGNHDIIWSGEGPQPKGHHEAAYEKKYGPLWYAVKHKGCRFIILFTDEGDPLTGEKTFDKASAQQFSPLQTAWLDTVLKDAKNDKQVFVFQHHPRWRGGAYGEDWQRIHKMLTDAKNVSAVFAGHDHVMRYYGDKGGIDYYTIGATGGLIPPDAEKIGQMQHYYVVTVRGDTYSITAVPVGKLMDPKSMKVDCLLERTAWRIDSPEKRSVEYPVEAKKMGAQNYMLFVGVENAFDDSGDKGLWCSILNQNGAVVSRKFFTSKRLEWMYCFISDSVGYSIVLEDQDAEVSGDHPGKEGTVEAWIKAL